MVVVVIVEGSLQRPLVSVDHGCRNLRSLVIGDNNVYVWSSGKFLETLVQINEFHHGREASVTQLTKFTKG